MCCRRQLRPFHRRASVDTTPRVGPTMPTAAHASVAGQAIPFSWFSAAPTGLGTCSMLQRPSRQRSPSVMGVPSPLPWPTAVQSDGEGQDTPLRPLELARAGLGTGWARQAAPFHHSPSGTNAPELLTYPPPTDRLTCGRRAGVADQHGELRPVGAGAACKLHFVPFHGGIAAMEAGRVELIAGDPAAAERALRPANETLRAIGEAGFRASVLTLLAEAAYAQGRFGQALRLTEEAEALAGADDYEAQGRWRATRAKVLARRGQFPAATRLADEAVTLAPAMHDSPEWAEFVVAQAEVHRLAGALDQAAASLRQALQFYEDRRIVPLAAQARDLLASLTRQTAPH